MGYSGTILFPGLHTGKEGPYYGVNYRPVLYSGLWPALERGGSKVMRGGKGRGGEKDTEHFWR